MNIGCVFRFAIPAALAVFLHAETVGGVVVVKRGLTKRRVTAAIPMYERGPVVGLGADSKEDRLSFERSRVAVYFEGRIPDSKESPTLARMEQINRRFSPEILVIQAGSRVSFPNFDPIFHNVFSLSRAKAFDLGNFAKGETRIVTFPEPGIVSVNCHLHSNMTATILVAPNRWNTRVDPDGHFAFQDVPAGQYTVVAWHKAAGYFRQQVIVTPGRNEHIEFLIPLDDDPKGK